MIIRINDNIGEGKYTRGPSVPPLPVPVALPATDIHIRSFYSNWEVSSLVSGFYLDVADTSNFSSFLSGFNNKKLGNIFTYPITGLDCSTTYYYRLRSYYLPSQPSANSNIIATTTTFLSTPVILPATNVNADRFTANWESVLDASGYYLSVDDTSDFSSPIPAYDSSDVGNVSSYIITGLTQDTSYYYQITAYNGLCISDDSSVIHTQKTAALPLPVALPATNINYTSFSANWQATPDVSGYYLDVALDNGFSSFVTGYNNKDVSNVLTYSITGLTVSTDYYYRIRYYLSTVTSGNSNIIDTSTKTLAPPLALPATDVSTNTFVSNWEFVADASGYYLYVDDSSDFSTPISAYNGLDVGDVSNYLVTGLTDDTTYYYRLKAYNVDTSSVYSNIIDVTTEIIIYYACATYSPYFTTLSSSSGFLTASALNSSTGTIGNYVIEWRLNSSAGDTVFVSGGDILSDASIQAQQPFVDEVVFAGTLYPIIKYIYIDGSKYTVNYEKGSRYSPDLINCLPSIIVDPITCSTIRGSDTLYPYYLSYVNTVDYGANKSRTFKYNISTSTNYLAWEFDAYSVAEQIKIYYCTSTNSSGTLLDNFIHGTLNMPVTNLYPENYPDGSARIYNRTSHGTTDMKYITKFIDISRNVDDYLKIEITGSVYEPNNNNTNWDIKLKCISSDDISCGWPYDTSLSKMVSDPSMYYRTDPTCTYDVSYNTVTTGTVYSKSSISVPWIWQYLDLYTTVNYSSNPGLHGNTLNYPVSIGLQWLDTVSNNAWAATGEQTCVNCNPGQSITYSLQTADISAIVMTFTDVSDYAVYANNCASINASPYYTVWQSSPDTSIEYYGYYRFYIKCASTCGDVGDYDFIYVHFSADVSFDLVNKTIKFPIVTLTNNIVDASCNNAHETADTNIGIISGMGTGRLPFSHYLPITTNTRTQNPGAGIFPFMSSTHTPSRENFYGYQIDDAMLNGICDLSTYGFVYDISAGSTTYNNTTFAKKWVQFRYWDKFTLTDTTDASTRLENWKLERRKFLRTDVASDVQLETVYEVSLGIVITDLIP